MNILIKGMKMPSSCESCPCKTADAFGGLGCQATGYIPLRKVNQDRPDWCPLVEVPPHGDLIDRSKLAWTPIDITDLPFGECLPVYLKEDVDNAPIVVESEE